MGDDRERKDALDTRDLIGWSGLERRSSAAEIWRTRSQSPEDVKTTIQWRQRRMPRTDTVPRPLQFREREAKTELTSLPPSLQNGKRIPSLM